MDDFLERWPDRPAEVTASAWRAADGQQVRRFHFSKRGQFLWKSALLLVTTVALVPILLWQHALAAQVYVAFLVAVHVGGLAIFALGVRRQDIAPTRRGLWVRLSGIGLLICLLSLAAKGLQGRPAAAVFWIALFAIWALHTAGLLLLHIKTDREAAACPFL